MHIRATLSAALLLAALTAPLSQAALLKYDLTFAPPIQGGDAPTGGFEYDDTTNLFTSFDVDFRGVPFDLINPANNPFLGVVPGIGVPGLDCVGGLTGPQATFAAITGGCPMSFWTWQGSLPPFEFYMFFQDDPASPAHDGFLQLMGQNLNHVPLPLPGYSTQSGLNNIVATRVQDAPVPEPALALPTLLALGCLAWRRRTRSSPKPAIPVTEPRP